MDNIYTVARPFLWILTLFGIFPLTFKDSPEKGKLKFKLGNVISTGVTFSLLLYFIVTALLQEVSIMPSKILSVALTALVFADMLLLIVMHVYQLSKHSGIKDFLALVHKYDNQVSPAIIVCLGLTYFISIRPPRSKFLEPGITSGNGLLLSSYHLACMGSLCIQFFPSTSFSRKVLDFLP